VAASRQPQSMVEEGETWRRKP